MPALAPRLRQRTLGVIIMVWPDVRQPRRLARRSTPRANTTRSSNRRFGRAEQWRRSSPGAGKAWLSGGKSSTTAHADDTGQAEINWSNRARRGRRRPGNTTAHHTRHRSPGICEGRRSRTGSASRSICDHIRNPGNTERAGGHWWHYGCPWCSPGPKAACTQRAYQPSASSRRPTPYQAAWPGCGRRAGCGSRCRKIPIPAAASRAARRTRHDLRPCRAATGLARRRCNGHHPPLAASGGLPGRAGENWPQVATNRGGSERTWSPACKGEGEKKGKEGPRGSQTAVEGNKQGGKSLQTSVGGKVRSSCAVGDRVQGLEQIAPQSKQRGGPEQVKPRRSGKLFVSAPTRFMGATRPPDRPHAGGPTQPCWASGRSPAQWGLRCPQFATRPRRDRWKPAWDCPTPYGAPQPPWPPPEPRLPPTASSSLPAQKVLSAPGVDTTGSCPPRLPP